MSETTPICSGGTNPEYTPQKHDPTPTKPFLKYPRQYICPICGRVWVRADVAVSDLMPEIKDALKKLH